MRVLYAVHALPAASLGGTELYTRRLAETLAGEHDVGIATPAGHETDIPGVDLFELPASADPTDPTGTESGLAEGVVDPAVDQRFAAIVDDFQPDVVHLQHLKSLSATLPEQCTARGIPSLMTLHDFWTLCHREQLRRPPGSLCVGPESVEKCAACYADAIGRSLDGGGHPETATAETADPHLAVRRRTRRLEAARSHVDRLVAPSAFLRERFVAFGTPEDAIVHRRNGVRLRAYPESGFDPSTPLRIGFAGRVTHVKGVHVLLDAFRAVEGAAHLDVFGRFEPDADPYHDRLRAAASEGVTFHGRYDAPARPYQTADVLVVPSLWYENSPLVIQEAFASGVPVVTGDVGGMAELVSHGVDGLTVPPGDVDALRRALQQLADEPGTVGDLREGIEPPTSLSTHANELLDLYERSRERSAVGETA